MTRRNHQIVAGNSLQMLKEGKEKPSKLKEGKEKPYDLWLVYFLFTMRAKV